MEKNLFIKNWVKMSMTLSLAYFINYELIHGYFEYVNFIHNYWTDSTIAGISVYIPFWKRYRSSNSTSIT